MAIAFAFSEAWSGVYPGAGVGLLVMTSVRNSAPRPELRQRLQSLEVTVRAQHAGQSRKNLESLPSMRPYVDYYRGFGKTYHVLLQLESVAFRQRPLAASESLVSAMFAAEVESHLLTAGHDLEAVRPPLLADVTRAGEHYLGIGGKAIDGKPGDLSIRDREGILSSVLYGPDERTRLHPSTASVLFTTYAPDGISETDLLRHLRGIEELVRAGSPAATTELMESRRP